MKRKPRKNEYVDWNDSEYIEAIRRIKKVRVLGIEFSVDVLQECSICFFSFCLLRFRPLWCDGFPLVFPSFLVTIVED